jgi:hypothetical protein
MRERYTFCIPSDLELVIDFESRNNTSGFYSCYFFGDNHYIQHISIMGRVLTNIADWFLYYCKSLKSIILPSSVDHIGNSCLNGCTTLASITIPNSVTHIGDGFLHRCISLTSISVPKNVNHIGDSCLRNCTSLTSITIPNSVTHIGEGFLYKYTNVRNIIASKRTKNGILIFLDWLENSIIQSNGSNKRVVYRSWSIMTWCVKS